jgi:hypothetical protein
MEVNDADICLPLFIDFAHDRSYLQRSIQQFLSLSKDEEINQLLIEIDKISNNFKFSSIQRAGVADTVDKRKLDMELYEFMMLCDSIHDFGRQFDINTIYKWIPCKLLSVFKKVKTFENNTNSIMVTRKRPIDLMEIKREEKLISYLTKPEQLWFEKKSIKNPFRGKNILKRYLYNPKLTLKDNIIFSRLNMKKTNIVKSIDFWINENDSNPNHFYLEQICYICTIIKQYLGENIEWITDISNPIYKLFTSFPLIQQKFLNSLNIQPNVKRDFVNNLNNRLHLEWTPIICDATMNDASETERFVFNKSNMQKGFDKNPTGSVYVDTFDFRFELQGAFYKRNGEMFYKLNEEEIQENQKENSLGANILYIKGKLKDLKNNLCTEEQAKKDIVHALAKKRSGDWGMVENCVVKKRAFITQDKLAAMYSIYRNVPVIYVHRVLRHKEIDQYTFVLVK